ncbi:MAG: MFS transporter [Acidimicrobiales bacterium]
MSETTSAPRPPIPGPIRALLLARFLITVGVVCQVTIVGKQVYDITGSALDLGLLGLAEFLPTALLSPITGSVADRFDRRKVLLGGLLGEGAAALALALLAEGSSTSVAPIFVVVFVFGVARAIVSPPIRALPVDLAPAGMVERILAAITLTFQIGAIIAPVIAGFLYVVSPATPYWFTLAMLVAGWFTLALFVPSVAVSRLAAPAGIRGALHDAFEGLRFVVHTPVLFGAIALDLFAVLFGGAVALLPIIADERLGVGAVGYGWLRASIGIGAASMSLAIAARPITRRIGPVLLSVVALFGVATIVLGLTTNYVVAFAALFVLSGADSVSMFIRSAIVPIATPEHMRGRVLATEQVFIGASNELGALESGVAAALIGTVGAVVSGGIGTIIVVGLFWRIFPDLSKADRFSELAPTPTAPSTA